ncbi:DUF2523 domain-containing protein [Vibrio atypicus]|jgi:hypothetical protein|uniref:DUF2523 domain-containing protein n=1 Tax=Vibrio atypicus TaxID=558271 RepID=UPI00142EB079|nr:DUF2523 domain-containing protein [Vibrio atypicus]
METLYSFFNWISLQVDIIVSFFESIPLMLQDLFSYIQLFIIKMKIHAQIRFIQLSFNTAKILLEEIGFNDILAATFNAMPSELRFYAFKFGIPQGLSILANFFTTSFVMRMTR